MAESNQYQLFPELSADELSELESDILARGVMVPVEYDESGNVLDGHHRLKICDRHGITDFPRVIRYGLSEAEKRLHVRKLNLARRHLTEAQKRVVIADALKDAPEKSNRQHAKELGVDDKTVASVRREKEQSAEIPHFSKRQDPRTGNLSQPSSKPNGKPKPPVSLFTTKASDVEKGTRPEVAAKIASGEAKTVAQAAVAVQRDQKREQLHQKAAASNGKGEWKVIHGDCIDELAKIEAGSVRLIFADPPYNIGIDYGQGEEADKLPSAQYLLWCREWIDLCVDRLADDGSFWLMINDEWADNIGVMMKEAGLFRRSWVKWYETFGVNCQDKFNRCSRHIFYCVKHPREFVFNRDAVSRPSDRQAKYDDPRADPAGKIWDDVWQIPRVFGTAKERIPEFPTQVPLEITRAIVGCASEPGDLVLDPFSGSGSTGVACVELGRRYVGIEQEERFVELSQLRLKGVS